MQLQTFLKAMQQNLFTRVHLLDDIVYSGMSYDFDNSVLSDCPVEHFWINENMTVEIYL